MIGGEVPIPQSIIGRARYQQIALTHDGQIFLESQSIEAARETYADQLQCDGKIGAPLRIRCRAEYPEQPGRPLRELETDRCQCADVERDEFFRVFLLGGCCALRVTNLE